MERGDTNRPLATAVGGSSESSPLATVETGHRPLAPAREAHSDPLASSTAHLPPPAPLLTPIDGTLDTPNDSTILSPRSHDETDRNTGTSAQQLKRREIEIERRLLQLELEQIAVERSLIEGRNNVHLHQEALKMAQSAMETPNGLPRLALGASVAASAATPLFSNTAPRPSRLAFMDDSARSGRVRETMGSTVLLNQSQLLARQGGNKELPKFSGRPEEWAIFIASYESSTELCGYTNEENMLRLQKALSGKALDAVRSRLLHPANLRGVIETLRMLFGRPEIIIHQLIQQIRRMPAPRLERMETLVNFGVAVQDMCATITATGVHAYMCDATLLYELTEKLPDTLRLDWARHRLPMEWVTLAEFGTWMDELLRAATLVSLPSISAARTEKKDYETRREKPRHYLNMHQTEDHATASSTRVSGCRMCEGSCNALETCKQFLDQTSQERWNSIRRLGVCRKCLTAHGTRCRISQPCGKNGCGFFHHPLLHDDMRYRDYRRPNIVSVHTHSVSTPNVLLKYVPVTVYGKNKVIHTFAFLDSGSTSTFVERSLADDLELEGKPHPLCLKWTGNTTKDESDSLMLSLKISAVGGTKMHKIAKALRSLSLPAQSVSASLLAARYTHLRDIPIRSYEAVRPRIIIGVDNYRLVHPQRYEEGGEHEPIAVKTPLGWILYGPCTGGSDTGATSHDLSHSFHICECSQDGEKALNALVKEHFAFESLGICKAPIPLLSKEDERALAILSTETKLKDGRFETGLLWRFDDIQLPCSKSMALKRYACLRKRMSKDAALAESVKETMKGYEHRGYIRRMSPGETAKKGPRDWYLPIFPVFNVNKPGKVRIVFDAAAKVNGVSLNSFLLSGPDLLAGLLSVLFKFREHRVAIVGDIKEMFFQVGMKAEDQRSQMFFWNEQERNDQGPSVYAVAVMTFGATCSPSSAQYVKNRNAERFARSYPRAVECIRDEHYVDDLLASTETVQEAIKLAEEVRNIHAEGGFEIRNWISNSRVVMEHLCGSPLEGDVNLGSEPGVEKVLGMWWNIAADEFTFRLSPKHDVGLLSGEKMPTKREVLRTQMTMYDPLGLIGNFLMYVKILLQEVWRAGIGWDEQLDGRLADKWLNWVRRLPMVLQVRVPRCYRQITSVMAKKVQLHVFCDASENGMAAVIYLRFEQDDTIECALVGSKTRVASLKYVSIPRMELQAAVIGARFATTICSSHRLTVTDSFFWTDSRDVICWLNSDHRRYSQFVAVRVGELLELTNSKQWRWLSTKMNVADEGTKWQKAPTMDPSSRWFRGPDFIWQAEDEWPASECTSEETSEEIRHNLLHHSVLAKPWLEFERISTWRSTVLVVAYVMRFASFIISKRSASSRGALTQRELARAEIVIFRLVQREVFCKEINELEVANQQKHPWKPAVDKRSVLHKLAPELDENGVLRSRGRLSECSWVDEGTRRPIILPRGHHVTQLLLANFHRRYRHLGHNTTLNAVRLRFYIPKLRSEYNRARRTCQHCKNRDARPAPPMMANLPMERLAAYQRPFTYTGVDYFGPISVAVGRRVEKRWGVMFTCLTIRAIHLEVAHSLNTSSCILAIQRFIAVQGKPVEFLSDCGTNFVGASRELCEAWKEVNEKRLAEEFTSPTLTWKFNPPGAPHFGGCWERLIKSVKKVMGEMKLPRLPTDEVRQTENRSESDSMTAQQH